MAAKKVVPVVLINFTHTVEDTLKYEILPLTLTDSLDGGGGLVFTIH